MLKDEQKYLVDTYVTDTYGRYDVVFAHGKGSYVYDVDGNRYLDFTSGIGVNALGFSDEGWVNAVSEQLKKLQHTSNLFYTLPIGIVAEKVIKKMGMKNMFFSNSGAEANEGAIKAARKYSAEKYLTKANKDTFSRFEIVTLDGSFHGRTIATITATGQDGFHKDFKPLLSGFKYAKTNDIEDLYRVINENTCALLMEFIQGEGGVNDIDEEYVDAIKKICEEKDILIIADEVQTGVGRTGKFMSYMHYDIKPDIVTVAKGLGGGLPIGAIIFSEKTGSVLKRGDHGSTFGGNPVVCAGANYVVDTLTEEFMKDVYKKGEYLKSELLKIDAVKTVSGKGFMLGIEIENGEASEIVKKALSKGLLILTAKSKIRLLPPLNMSIDEIDEGIEILKNVLAR